MPTRPGMLDRAVAITNLFSETQVEWRVSDIAGAVSLPIPTTYRIVNTLVEHGLLRPTSGGFRLGSAALDLGRRAAAGFDLGSAIGLELRSLAATTGETCVLSVLDESNLVGVCVDRVDSAQPVRLVLDVGRRVPLHAGAASKALLAFAPASIREAVLTGPLPQLAPGTLTSSSALRTEIEVIRQQGYAISREETNENAWGIAAPILGVGDVVLGSIGMVAPMTRNHPDQEEMALREVCASAIRAQRAITG